MSDVFWFKIGTLRVTCRGDKWIIRRGAKKDGKYPKLGTGIFDMHGKPVIITGVVDVPVLKRLAEEYKTRKENTKP